MPIAKRMRRHTRREDGQAVVEFALIMPVLLLLLLGIVQFGTVFRDYIALTDAVRVGARQASVARTITPASQQVPTIVARVQKAAVNLDKNKMTITVDPVMINGQPGWEAGGDVTVRATYPFKINLFGLVLFGGSLQSRTTDRVE